MSKLAYNGRVWRGMLENEEGLLWVSMPDATFQRHLNAYLEQLGVPTQTYLELMEMVQRVCEQRFQASQQLENLEYWSTCSDPEVRIVRHPCKRTH